MQDALNSSKPNLSLQSLPESDSEDDLLRIRNHTSVGSSRSVAAIRDSTSLPTSPSLGSRMGLSPSTRSHDRPTSNTTSLLSPFDAIVEPESRSREFSGIANNGVPSVADEYDDLTDEDHSIRDLRTSQNPSNHEMQRTNTVFDHPKMLRRHTMALWLVSMFAAVTIFAWTITCVLCYKPIQFGTYYDRTGRYTRKQYDDNNRWRKLSRVLMSLLSNVSIPVTSAICARAVAIYSQSSSKLQRPSLTMRQTLALADKGWTDTMILSGLLRPDAKRRVGSPLLIFSALLCGLALLISFLQGALVDTMPITAMTNADTGERVRNTIVSQSDAPLYKVVGTVLPSFGSGIDPWDIAAATVSGKITDQQPNLWIFDNGTRNLTSFQAFYSQPLGSSAEDRQTTFSPPAFFTSSLPVGTDTGILQASALRLNTSLNCEEIPHSNYPASCDGNAQFTTNYSNADVPEAKADSYSGPMFTFRACIPGNSQWIPGENRLEISEDVYLDLQSSRAPAIYHSYDVSIVSNFSYHCTSNTMLAVFEAPNYWNGHQIQDVVDLRPQNTNVYFGANALWEPVIRSDNSDLPGPLQTSIRALFGEYTFFADIALANDTHDANLEICYALTMPLQGLCNKFAGICTPFNVWNGESLPSCLNPVGVYSNDSPEQQHPNGTLAFYLFLFLQKFNDLDSTIAALTFTNFYTSKAMLDPTDDGHIVYASPGLQIQKVHVPLAGLIVISVLIILQLTGLFSLALYASRHATWTELLDSFALLRLGAAMADDLPLISALEAKELAVLDEKEGWVGDAGDAEGVRMLRIGGEECTRNDTPYRSVDQGRTFRFKKGI